VKTADRQNIRQLVRRLARDPATEDLIGFVADHDGMLGSCRRILDGDREDAGAMSWFREECERQNIDPRAVTAEMERLLKIFHAGESRDHELYAVLGLESGASVEDVKRAFRKLSVRYHPDSAGSGAGGDPERFIAICQAYKAILSGKGAGRGRPRPEQSSSNPWLYKRKSKGISPGQKKKNILLFALLAGVLLLISILAPFVYRKKVMLSQYGARSGGSAPLELSSGTKAPDEQQHDSGQHRDLPPAVELSGQELDASTPVEAGPGDRRVESAAPAPPPVPTARENQEMIARTESVMIREQNLPPDSRSGDPVAKKPGRMGTVSSGQQRLKDIAPAPEVTGQDSARNKPGEQEERIATKPAETGTIRHPDRTRVTRPPEQAPAAERQRLAHAKVLPRISEPHGKGARQKTPARPETEIFHKNTRPVPRPAVLPGRKEHAGPGKPVRTGMEGELLRLRLMSFLESYTASYERKDLRAFASYFTRDAVENGASFRSLRNDYEHLFAAVETISFSIVPESWETVANMIRLHGRFYADLAYHDGRDVRLKGKISLLLEDRTASLKVKELAYWFDK